MTDQITQSVQQIVRKVGYQKAGYLLSRIEQQLLSKNSSFCTVEASVRFILETVSGSYGLELDQLINCDQEECREARTICYLLMKDFAHCSYAKIGWQFGRSKRQMHYHISRGRDLLEIPRAHPRFNRQYNHAENQLIEFLKQ